MDKLIQLLPCPFCGSLAAWGEGEQKAVYGNEQVYCPSCYATSAPYSTPQEALKAWNTRLAALARDDNAVEDAVGFEVQGYRNALKDALDKVAQYERMMENTESIRLNIASPNSLWIMLRKYTDGTWRIHEGDEQFSTALEAFQALTGKE